MSLPHRYRQSSSVTATTPATTDSTTSPDRTGSAPAPDAPDRPLLDWRLRFAALSLIWGFSFLLIKVGTQGYAPFQVTLGRLAFGTAVLAIAMAVRREGCRAAPAPGGIWRSPVSC